MKIETELDVKDDIEITKDIIADTAESALSKALALLKEENPVINYMKVWCWMIQERNV
jgi:hypothetical protein